MTRTTTRKSTRTGHPSARKYQHTDTQRAEAARRDAELLGRVHDRLADDPGFIRDFVTSAVDGMSARILGYSLRNQMMLHDQATERGITLRDVDTYRGWRNRRRPRQVRKGERGLRIIAPVGHDEAEGNEDQEAPEEPTNQEIPRVRFRTMTVFEISQTDNGEDASEDRDCPLCAAGEPCNPDCHHLGCTCGNEPAGILWNNLCEQITRAGYQVEWTGDDQALSGHRTRVDHDTRILHIAMTAVPIDPDVLADIATVLAEIITHAARSKQPAPTTR